MNFDPNQPLPDLDSIRLSLFEILCKQHEINDQFALEGYEIIIVCDNSGSMNTPVTNSLVQIKADGQYYY